MIRRLFLSIGIALVVIACGAPQVAPTYPAPTVADTGEPRDPVLLVPESRSNTTAAGDGDCDPETAARWSGYSAAEQERRVTEKRRLTLRTSEALQSGRRSDGAVVAGEWGTRRPEMGVTTTGIHTTRQAEESHPRADTVHWKSPLSECGSPTMDMTGTDLGVADSHMSWPGKRGHIYSLVYQHQSVMMACVFRPNCKLKPNESDETCVDKTQCCITMMLEAEPD